MKIKKGDTVLIISGKDRGKKGKVLEVFPQEKRLLVEGINLKKKHMRPKREGEKGQVVELALPIHISKTKLICPRCQKATRVGYDSKEESQSSLKSRERKFRVCKKCGKEI
jgi:large subunit ribosomal protein L24